MIPKDQKIQSMPIVNWDMFFPNDGVIKAWNGGVIKAGNTYIFLMARRSYRSRRGVEP